MSESARAVRDSIPSRNFVPVQPASFAAAGLPAGGP